MYEDRDGILTIPKHHDSTEIYTLDWSDLLDPSETISSSSFTADGVTVCGGAAAGKRVRANGKKRRATIALRFKQIAGLRGSPFDDHPFMRCGG